VIFLSIIRGCCSITRGHNVADDYSNYNYTPKTGSDKSALSGGMKKYASKILVATCFKSIILLVFYCLIMQSILAFEARFVVALIQGLYMFVISILIIISIRTNMTISVPNTINYNDFSAPNPDPYTSNPRETVYAHTSVDPSLLPSKEFLVSRRNTLFIKWKHV
jgi:hypothetical protein